MMHGNGVYHLVEGTVSKQSLTTVVRIVAYNDREVPLYVLLFVYIHMYIFIYMYL